MKLNIHMVKRIVSFGCSLIYGDELQDWDPGDSRGRYPRDNPSQGVWPNKVAQSLGVPHVNKGFSGASNEFILRQLTRYLCYPTLPNYEWKLHSIPNLDAPLEEGDLVIIQWTSHYRNEVYNRDRKFMTGCNFDHYVQLQVESLAGEQSQDRNIYEHLLIWQDENSAAERFLNNMMQAEALLRSKGVQFVQCFGLAEPTYSEAMQSARNGLTLWDNHGHFLRYANVMQEPIGKGFHPLEGAHTKYAEAFLRDNRINKI